MLALIRRKQRARACRHITGGGFYENIPRSLPAGAAARASREGDVRVLPHLRPASPGEGSIPERDMFNTFNMGVGMVLTVAAEDALVAMAMMNGLTSAIVNPNDLRLMETIKSCDVFKGNTLYADSYLEI